MLQYTTNKRGEEGRLEHSQPLHYLNPLNPKSDQHLTSPYSNTAESFTKLMRIKEMITNLRSIDLQMNSLFQYHKKHTKNSMENMDTDVRVSRVKHLHIQWYNTCTLLEIGCLGDVDTFNGLLHNIMRMMMMMVLMMETYKMDVIWWSNKVFSYYDFVYLLWTLRKENNKYVIDPLNEQHIVMIKIVMTGQISFKVVMHSALVKWLLEFLGILS